MGNDVDNMKLIFIKYYHKDQVVDHMKKLIEEAMWCKVDGHKFIYDQSLAYFDYWVKNKAQNKQLVDNIFPPPKPSEVVTPQVAKM